VNGRMLWFDEATGFGFILTEEGERIYVHRSGFLPGEGSGRSLRPPPGAIGRDRAERQARCHRRVDGSGSARAGAPAGLELPFRVAVTFR
jgi:hypothetical protein